MKYKKKYFLFFLLAFFIQACTDKDSDKAAPQITAQGFLINDVQEGTLGHFGSLKLRIESSGRIKQLYIKERSYEVDLATTPERGHFSLFGIEKRVLLRTDITLDFQNYINQKLTGPGQYVIRIEVVDKEGQSADAVLTIHVIKPLDAKTSIETGRFQMQREGKGLVAGSKPFGIAWKTIDEIMVTVRLTKAKDGASKLARFSLSDYEQLSSKEDLSKKIHDASDVVNIEFATANNSAANQVFGVARRGRYYMLKTQQSDTRLSSVGTTVRLNGEYKF